MKMILAAILALVLTTFLLVLGAHGAEPRRVIEGYTGGYHQHDAEWEGRWIAQDFPSCCGKQDCFKANTGDGLTVVRAEDGGGFIVTMPQINGKDPITEFVPYNAPILRPSQDGEYWVCHRVVGGDGTRMPRCLFVPPLGF